MDTVHLSTEVPTRSVTNGMLRGDHITFYRAWPWPMMASEKRGLAMIRVTTMDGRHIVINSDLIETVQATPDTVITFMDGKKLIVKDTVDDVVNRIIEFRHRVLTWPESTDVRS